MEWSPPIDVAPPHDCVVVKQKCGAFEVGYQGRLVQWSRPLLVGGTHLRAVVQKSFYYVSAAQPGSVVQRRALQDKLGTDQAGMLRQQFLQLLKITCLGSFAKFPCKVLGHGTLSCTMTGLPDACAGLLSAIAG